MQQMNCIILKAFKINERILDAMRLNLSIAGTPNRWRSTGAWVNSGRFHAYTCSSDLNARIG